MSHCSGHLFSLSDQALSERKLICLTVIKMLIGYIIKVEEKDVKLRPELLIS